jgi:hypothetical protein
MATMPLEKPQVIEEKEKPAKEEQEDELPARIEKVDKVVSPLQLADVLYRQGYNELAFKNYCAVGEQLTEEKVADLQWILFQKANCLRRSDPDKAVGFYNELIESYPNSTWTKAAKSQLKMIEWGHTDQGKSLLGDERDDTSS